jgi:phosphoglycerate dehydrogenase-like enzyme
MAKVPATALVMHPTVAHELLTADHCARLKRICRFVPDPATVSLPTADDAGDGSPRLVILDSFEALTDHRLQVEVLITSWGCPRIDQKVLQNLPRLRLIAHMGGSVKGFIDDLAWRRGILVINAAAAAAVPVAEFTLGCILLANKHAFTLERRFARQRVVDAEAQQTEPALGNYRKTIGIIGASKVGRHLMLLLQPFEYRVLLYDPYIAPSDARALGAIKMGLNEVLSKADVVTLHAPLLPETERMLGARELTLLRDGATLINTAQGRLIDQDALEAELLSGRLNAIMDVTDPEPLPATSPLFDLSNVFLTPQIAGSRGAEVFRYAEVITEELERYARGAALKHLVRRDQLPRLA